MTDSKEVPPVVVVNKDAYQLAIKVLATALNDKGAFDKLCKEYEPEGFPKSLRNFAKIVWEICRNQRSKLTQDVLTSYLETTKLKAEIVISCNKAFLDCQLVKTAPEEMEHFLPRLKEYRADRLIREALQGKDEEGQIIHQGTADLLIEGKPYEAAKQLKAALAKVEALTQTDPVIRVELTERAPQKLKEYEARKTDKSQALGLLTGFGPLDDVTRGMGPGEMFLWCGRPGSGKSICLLNAAKNIFKAKKNVMLFSLEMPFQQYEDRFISTYADINNERMLMGALSSEEEQKLKTAWEEIHGMTNKFQIIDFPRLDSFQIETELSRAIDKHHPDVVLIDYLGIMKPNDKSSTADWEQQGKISDEVRAVARTYRLPIASAVQLNRSKTKEKSADRLSRSDQISQNADVIAMINDDEDKQVAALSDMMKLTLIKNRKGADGFEFEMYKNFANISLQNPQSYTSRIQNLLIGP